ncbi:relaxase domain-containing protein [Nocardia vinacea]|uniref:MobF family relaxase n=1 Tax=Nocardia vinacea TaxID=96468 RepID=UPI002E0DC179|nr:relaxase domain-containing protein [Nocardia vinacea]
MTATLHKVVAGNGYQYYLRNVAANDDPARGRSSLADYYSVHGESPGRWHGTGLAALGIGLGDEVTEDQMKSLFGLGRHPNADAIEARVFDEQIDAGAKIKDASRAADKASKLGHPFRVYSDVTEYRKRCAQAYEEHNTANGSDLDDNIPDDIRARIRTEVATEMFTEQYDRAPLDARELSSWVARNSRPKATAVAGFDITFSPVKSVSALWALAPRSVSEKIEDAHHAAIEVAVRWLEQHAIFTRLGRNGVRQVDVEGLVAAMFTHRESRAGDPDLHTHMLIANRVRTLDGQWRTLDGAMIYQHMVTVSEIYNTSLELFLGDMVGVEFTERPGLDPSKRPIREIVGIPTRLNELWSARDAAITKHLGRLTVEFQRRLGREPLPAETFDLMDRATLQTRPDKHRMRSRAQQRSDWRAQALTELGGREAVARMVSAALNPVRRARTAVDGAWIARTAETVVETVSAQRSTWQHHHIRSETERQIRGHIRLGEWERIAEAVVAEALSPSSVIARGDPDIADEPRLQAVPVMFARRDGTSVHTRAGSQVYTSKHVLGVTQQLIDLAVQPGGRQIPSATIEQAVHAYNTTHPDKQLNAGQIAAIHGFATSPLRVHAIDAPAGTGKTTAMRVLADAWHASGGTVLGLAPTAAAAAELGTSIGARVETVDKVLDVLGRHTPTLENLARDGNRPPPSLPQWVLQIDSDTLVIVDEHIKIGNLKRLRLLQFLAGRDATIRCLGDPKQLPSIEAGGAHTDMNTATNNSALTLSHVVRFTSPGEASASLLLREGDPAALGFYLDHRRIHSGSAATTHDDTYTGWIDDHLGGRDSIMLAATHDIVGELNQRARQDRIARSGAHVGPECVLADGLRASVGDTILTRRNDRRLRVGDRDWVRNGYRWIVSDVHDDGSLAVTHLRSGRERGHTVALPARYVSTFVRLGYATTIDSAQGVTAETCHVALTGYETRAQLYVAMTRGAHTNHAYVPTTLDGSEASFYSEPAVFPRTAVEVLLRIFGRDGTQKSAHTELRDALNPFRRIGRAVNIYLDAIGVAAENALGADGLAALDDAAEALRAGLTDCPAYPILRQHLASIALTGADPIPALHTAAAGRELDTADDVAAVLDWRLDPSGAHSCGVGPLPWTRGLPRGLDEDTDSGQLAARARIVADLATAIRTEARDWTAATAPFWARTLIGSDPKLLADLAVWRASLHVDDRDLRPTGPARRTTLEREHQQLLDAQVIDAIGDIDRPVTTWSPVVKQLDERITTDPYWPTLADKIDLADRAGIDIKTRLCDAAALRPLPDEMPAAALWSRLELEPSALDHATGDRDLRPPWTTELHDILGTDTGDRIIHDPAWPRIVAAIDRATGTDWTPYELLTTAHELLQAAQPDNTRALRPDQLASALAWRIDALLHHNPTANQPDREPEPQAHVVGGSDRPSNTTTGDRPETRPHSGDFEAEGIPVDIGEIAELLRTGQIRTAAAAFRELTDNVADEQRAIIERVAETLYHYAFPIALARLRYAADQFPEHRALIESCTPSSDPHVYQPATESAAPRYRRDQRHEAARDNPTRTESSRSDMIPQPIDEDSANAVEDYLDTRANVDDNPFDQPLPEGVPHHYDRDVIPESQPDGYVLDYDLAAVPDSHGLSCVCCGLERARIDITPISLRRSDDGLCGDCRDNNEPGIPDHDPTDHIQARCDHIAAIHPPEAARAILRRDWRASGPVARARITAWTTAHPLPEPVTTPTLDALGVLSETELHQSINDLYQCIALADTDAFIYNPHVNQPDPHDEEAGRHQQEARQAIHNARTSIREFEDAERAVRAVTTQIDSARTTLVDTPVYRRSQLRALNTQIASLETERQRRTNLRDSARTTARNAQRRALQIAGPAEEWEQILTADSQPASTSTTSQPAEIDPAEQAHAARIADFEQQLEQLLSEQHRRTQLNPIEADIEQQLRQQLSGPDDESFDYFDDPVDISQAQHEHDFGL